MSAAGGAGLKGAAAGAAAGGCRQSETAAAHLEPVSQLRRRLLAEAVQRQVAVDDAGSEQALGGVQVAVLWATKALRVMTGPASNRLQPGCGGMPLPNSPILQAKPHLTMGWSSSCTVCSKTLSIVLRLTHTAVPVETTAMQVNGQVFSMRRQFVPIMHVHARSGKQSNPSCSVVCGFWSHNK